jgi:hypothetical protein
MHNLSNENSNLGFQVEPIHKAITWKIVEPKNSYTLQTP